MKKLVRKLAQKLQSRSKFIFPVEATKDEISSIEFCKNFSMTSYERMYATLLATKYVINNRIKGSFVECGVWRGGNAILMAMTLGKMDVKDRNIFLYDTFEGMSEPSKHDKDSSGLPASLLLEKADKRNGESIWCIASIEDVKNNFAYSHYPEEMVKFVKGDVGITLKDEESLPQEIALLRLDTDWYESTKIELEVLFPRLVRGGVCLIDDYGHWQGARKAVDEYLEMNAIYPLMHVTDYTGRVFLKP